jgi:hypothetical protein
VVLVAAAAANAVLPSVFVQDKTTLAAYISYARKHIQPKLSEAAARDLMQRCGTAKGRCCVHGADWPIDPR